MIKEIYLYKRLDKSDIFLADIDDSVNVVRNYKTPFFTELKDLQNDGTLTVKLPKTSKNLDFFGYIDRNDFDVNALDSSPYIKIYSDHYVNGYKIWEKAECNVLACIDNIEVQFIWGIDSNFYKALSNKKLTEFSTTDFIIEWNDYAITNPNVSDKWKFLNYISLIRKSEKYIIDGVIQPQLLPPAPFSGLTSKHMTNHPFLSFGTILDDLICPYLGIENTLFSELKARLANKGIVLSGKEDNYTYQWTPTITNYSYNLDYLHLQIGSNDSILTITNHFIYLTHESFKDDTVEATMTFDFTLQTSTIQRLELWKQSESDSSINLVQLMNTLSSDFLLKCKDTIDFTIEDGYRYYIRPYPYAAHSYNYKIYNEDGSLSSIKLTSPIKKSYFAFGQNTGRFNCIANLPDMYINEFISNLMVLTGLVIGIDSSSKLKTFSLDKFKENIDNGIISDWTGLVSDVKKSSYNFNSNAKNNYIKFNNNSDLKNEKINITVDNENINSEKDLFNLGFDSGLGDVNSISEIILYEQEVIAKDTGVSFNNTYKGDSFKTPVVKNVNGYALNIDILERLSTITNPYYKTYTGHGAEERNIWFCDNVTGHLSGQISVGDKLYSMDGTIRTDFYSNPIIVTEIIDNEDKIVFSADIFDMESEIVITNDAFQDNYSVYKKIVNRPIVVECDVNLDFFDTVDIDFEKPIYVGEWGKYCLLLELTAPDNEVSVAKLLIINQPL